MQIYEKKIHFQLLRVIFFLNASMHMHSEFEIQSWLYTEEVRCLKKVLVEKYKAGCVQKQFATANRALVVGVRSGKAGWLRVDASLSVFF